MKTGFWWAWIVGVVVGNPVFGQAETKPGHVGIRAGYLRATTDVTPSQGALNYGVVLLGIGDKPGWYGGVYYHRRPERQLTYRVEANYQQKGVRNYDVAGNFSFTQPFHYLNLTPLLCLTPSRRVPFSGLKVLLGPEANLRVGAVPPGRGNKPAPVELGTSGRVVYQYGRVGLEAAYFRALNEFNQFEENPIFVFGYKNQSWTLGLSVALSGGRKPQPRG